MIGTERANQRPLPDVTSIDKSFWEAAKKGKLVLQECGNCGAVQWYPKPWCADCGSLDVGWTESKGRGTVYSFTIPRRVMDNSPVFESQIPFIIAIVELEEGPRMYSNIIECKPEQASIGMPVEVVFEKATDEIQLPKFRPRRKV